MTGTRQDLEHEYRTTLNEMDELYEKARDHLGLAMSLLGDVLRLDREADRIRQAAEAVAAAEGVDLDLDPHERVSVSSLRAEARSRTETVRSGPKQNRASDDADRLEEIADALSRPAGGSTDRLGLVRDRLERLNDRELAERLEFLIEIVEQEERAARPAARTP